MWGGDDGGLGSGTLCLAVPFFAGVPSFTAVPPGCLPPPVLPPSPVPSRVTELCQVAQLSPFIHLQYIAYLFVRLTWF